MDLAGQAMLITAGGLVLIGLLDSLPRFLRVRRRALDLSHALATHRAELVALLEEQARLQDEVGRSSEPQRRLLRWLRHPLVGALWASYRIRRRRPGSALTPP
jgi:hypothetical protein